MKLTAIEKLEKLIDREEARLKEYQEGKVDKLDILTQQNKLIGMLMALQEILS